MGPVTALAILVPVWWTVLFVILPLGVKSHHDMGTRPEAGWDHGAPTNPNLKRKFVTTTWISLIVWGVILAVIYSGLVPLDRPPLGWR